MNQFMVTMGTIAAGIITIAIVAVLMSKNSQTPAVINSAWNGFAKSIQAATGPVLGGGFTGASFGSMGNSFN